MFCVVRETVILGVKGVAARRLYVSNAMGGMWNGILHLLNVTDILFLSASTSEPASWKTLPKFRSSTPSPVHWHSSPSSGVSYVSYHLSISNTVLNVSLPTARRNPRFSGMYHLHVPDCLPRSARGSRRLGNRFGTVDHRQEPTGGPWIRC